MQQIDRDGPAIDGIGRRAVIRGTAGVAMASTVGFAVGSDALAQQGLRGGAGGPSVADLGYVASRPARALTLRIQAAQSQLVPAGAQQPKNGDESLYADLRSVYAKALPHNDLGEPDPAAYRVLLDALRRRDSDAFETIPLAPGAVRRLTNPQASLAFELLGRDSHATRIDPAPSFAGPRMAAEMLEVYWQALCRDVPFAAFDRDPLVAAALAELNHPDIVRYLNGGAPLTAATLFRGRQDGNAVGPYISQFLYKPIPYGLAVLEQTYRAPAPGTAYMTTLAEWLAIQRGASPAPAPYESTPRYIHNGRVLAEYVHLDWSYQAYLGAALILMGAGDDVLDRANPYRTATRQMGFVTLGLPDIADLVAKAGRLAFTGAWFQKWLCHRQLRPEAMGGRVDAQVSGRKVYGLPAALVGSAAVDRVRLRYGTGLLPLAFPEGSPTHPSYPAGHACVAAACVTVLKAFFEEDAPVPDPVQPNHDGTALVPWHGRPLTVGGELNKLAANISIGRDWAGVHYRADGDSGLQAGEQQGIALLQDYSRIYNERFDGFTLTKFDGTRVRIRSGQVAVA